MKFITVPVFACLLWSCTKEYNKESRMDDVLLKSVTRMGRDSLIYQYRIDLQNRFIIEEYDSRRTGAGEKTQTVLYRNNGIIEKVVHRGGDFALSGIDSVVYSIGYYCNRYSYKVATYTVASTPYYDSTAYSYYGKDHIAIEEHFINNLRTKKEYIYTGDNLTLHRNWEYKNGSYNLLSEEFYTYDDRPAPLFLGVEAILAGKTNLISANNPLEYSYKGINNVRTYVAAYSYYAGGKPTSALLHYTNPEANFSSSYRYKESLQ